MGCVGQSDTLHLFQVYILDKVDVHPQLCFRVSPCGWVGTTSEGAGRLWWVRAAHPALC